MKKIFFILMISILFLTGCNTNNKGLKLDSATDKILIQKDYYFDDEILKQYDLLEVTDKKDIKSIINNLNKLELQELDGEAIGFKGLDHMSNFEYHVSYNKYDIYLLNSTYLKFINTQDNINKFYKIDKGTYSFLDNFKYTKNSNFLIQNFKDLDYTNGVTIRYDRTKVVDTKDINIINNLKELKYVPVNDTIKPDTVFDFTLIIGEIEIDVIDKNKIYIFDNLYKVLDQEDPFHKLLELVLFEDVITYSLSGLDYTKTITIKNITKNETVDATGKTEVINRFKQIMYMDYINEDTLTESFVITINEDVITLYSENNLIFKLNDKFYKAVSGSFDFVKSKNESSDTGWLPWI